MGRRTWESLPDRFRPLPGRTNVVLTSDRAGPPTGPGRAASVEQVLAEHESFWVIGGGAVYAAFLPHADRLVVTDVDVLVEGDTWAPRAGRRLAAGRADPGRGVDDVLVRVCGSRCRSTCGPGGPSVARSGRFVP